MEVILVLWIYLYFSELNTLVLWKRGSIISKKPLIEHLEFDMSAKPSVIIFAHMFQVFLYFFSVPKKKKKEKNGVISGSVFPKTK